MPRPRRLIVAVLALATLLVSESRTPAARGDEWSPEYKESLRRTVERRQQRRRARVQAQARRSLQGQGADTIVPYPLPPSLIIRQTPEAHDEIRDLLRLLRGR